VSDTGSAHWASSFKYICLQFFSINEMSNIYRGSSIDASYQVSYHLAKRLQRKSCFRNWPIRNKTCLWQPYLLIDRDGKHLWKVLYWISSKQNERWVTQAQWAEPLVLFFIQF
jgi:hypothetical protein